MEIKLKNSYPSIHGLPVIHSVETDIFDFIRDYCCCFCSMDFKDS